VGGKRISEGVTGGALDHPGRLGCPKAVGNEGLGSVIPVSPKGFDCFFRKHDLSLFDCHYAASWRAVKRDVSDGAPLLRWHALLRPYRAWMIRFDRDPGRCPLAVPARHGIAAHNRLGPRSELCALLRAGSAMIWRPFWAWSRRKCQAPTGRNTLAQGNSQPATAALQPVKVRSWHQPEDAV
jgi:hypothetical protein